MAATTSSFFCHELAPGQLQRQFHNRHASLTGSDGQLVAALGVLSGGANRAPMRNASRHAWLDVAPMAGIAGQFVLRGLGLAHNATAWTEADRFGDMLFLNTSAELTRQVGPLVSLFYWYECAMQQYPDAPFVGKMDDDAWLQPIGIGEILRNALPWVDQKWAAYVGRFECYSWHVVDEGPMKWKQGSDWSRCHRPRDANGTKLVGPNPDGYMGPFAFAKGGANFLSARLVRGIVRIRRDHVWRIVSMGKRCIANKARAANDTSCKLVAHTAWEDVWTGYVLSMSNYMPQRGVRSNVSNEFASTIGPMVLIDLSSGFIDTYGLTTRQGILAWHGRIDQDFPRRAALLKAWHNLSGYCDWQNTTGQEYAAPLRDCNKVVSSFTAEESFHKSCVGGELLYCRVNSPARCNNRPVDVIKNRTILSTLLPHLKLIGSFDRAELFEAVRRN